MSDRYRTITAELRLIRGASILVRRRQGGEVFVPRSVIHGGDDLRLERVAVGAEITIRVMAWKAEELSLS